MSAVTDKLPAYPDGLDIYPESYYLQVPKEKLMPLAVATRSEEYRKVFQWVISRSDTLLDYDDDGDACFVVKDSLLLYLEENGDDVFLVTKAKDDSTDPAVITTKNKKLMNNAISVLTDETVRAQEKEARQDKEDSDTAYNKAQLEKMGVVMYDHPLLMGNMSATELADLV